jgi:hypothetical protein
VSVPVPLGDAPSASRSLSRNTATSTRRRAGSFF